MSQDLTKSVRDYLAKIGQKGGETRGHPKRRGGPEYYRALAQKRWGKRRKLNTDEIDTDAEL